MNQRKSIGRQKRRVANWKRLWTTTARAHGALKVDTSRLKRMVAVFRDEAAAEDAVDTLMAVDFSVSYSPSEGGGYVVHWFPWEIQDQSTGLPTGFAALD